MTARQIVDGNLRPAAFGKRKANRGRRIEGIGYVLEEEALEVVALVVAVSAVAVGVEL